MGDYGFRSGSGRLCLDFVRTLRHRGDRENEIDELPDMAALEAWVSAFRPTDPKPKPTPHKPGPTQHEPASTDPKPRPIKYDAAPSGQEPKPTKHDPDPTAHEPKPTRYEPGPSGQGPSPTQHKPGSSRQKPTPTQHDPDPTRHEPTPTKPESGLAGHESKTTQHGSGATGQVLGSAGWESETDGAGRVDGVARELREAVYRLIAIRMSGGDLAAAAREREVVNRVAALPPPSPRLDETGDLRWQADRRVEAVLSLIARDALDLVTSPLIQRVHECANPACAALFLDSSRPGTRRWCSMNTCGNQAKKQTLRSRATNH